MLGLALRGTLRRAAPVPATSQPGSNAPGSSRAGPVPAIHKLRLPAPRLAAVAPPGEVRLNELRPTNLLARLFEGEEVRLRPEQLGAYLAQNRRSAESLVAAFRSTQQVSFLREALEKYPGDARVNYAA